MLEWIEVDDPTGIAYVIVTQVVKMVFSRDGAVINLFGAAPSKEGSISKDLSYLGKVTNPEEVRRIKEAIRPK